MGRPSANSCFGLGEESILRARCQRYATGQRGGTRSTRSIDDPLNPQRSRRRRPRGHDLDMVRRGFSHRSNWMSIAGSFALVSSSGRRPNSLSGANFLALARDDARIT